MPSVLSITVQSNSYFSKEGNVYTGIVSDLSHNSSNGNWNQNLEVEAKIRRKNLNHDKRFSQSSLLGGNWNLV